MKKPYQPIPNLPIERRALVRAVVISQGEVLIIHRAANESFMPDIWQLPAGGIEVGEHPEWAIRRELDEETGLVAKYLQIIGADSYWAIGIDSQEDWANFNFLAVPANREVVLSHEHQDYQWVPITKAAEKLTLPEDLAALMAAIDLNKAAQTITKEAGL